MKSYNYQGINYLSTNQVAELLDVDRKSLNRNFQRNKEKYSNNEHYILLEGNVLREFKKMFPNDEELKYVSILYLWTKNGVRLLSKSSRSSKAWDLIEKDMSSAF